MVVPSAPSVEASLIQIFRTFLLIGATSFGGGVVAYLRSSLVEKRGWLDDESFVQLLAMSQRLRGLSLAKGALVGWASVLIAGGVFLLLIRTKINPALLVLCGAVAGLFAFGLG